MATVEFRQSSVRQIPIEEGTSLIHEEYTLGAHPRPEMLAVSEELADAIDPRIAGIIAGQMHFNSPTSEKGRPSGVQVARPTSAYYIVTDDALYVEWARGSLGGTKSHDYIRRIGNYDKRFWNRNGDTCVRSGNFIRSGHLADIILRNAGRIFRAALFDSLAASLGQKTPKPGTVEHSAAITLLNNGTIPITSDGYIARFS